MLQFGTISSKINLTVKSVTVESVECVLSYYSRFVLKCNCRQEQFEQSAQGRAARAQQAAMAKQSASSNKGEPVLKV